MPAIDWSSRFEEMVAYVGLTDEERQLIKDSAPIINAQARQMNDDIYDQILTFPEARKFFVTEDDKPDEKRIEDNKLYFREVDVLDQTPLLDIKPYVKYFDWRQNVVSGWAG